jgi:hypothetical protein
VDITNIKVDGDDCLKNNIIGGAPPMRNANEALISGTDGEYRENCAAFAVLSDCCWIAAV